jgi:hypothetical protein
VLLVEDGREAAAAGVRARGRAGRGRVADGSSGSNGRDCGANSPSSSSDEEEDVGDAAEGGEVGAAAAKALFTPATVRRAAGMVRASGAGGVAGEGGEWWEFQLPQGSWVRSRRCDNGFRDFFGVSVQRGRWEAEPWAKYVQPGGVLSLRGCIWNVR